MELRKLKDWVNSLSEEDLNKPLGYHGSDYCISGFVHDVIITTEDYYWLGEDDPSSLYTLKELQDNYDEDEISKFMIEIHKGDPIIMF